MKRVVDNPNVEIAQTGRALRPATEASRLDTDVFRAIEKVTSAMFPGVRVIPTIDRKSTRLNSSHANISYAVFCLKKKKSCTTRARGPRSRLRSRSRDKGSIYDPPLLTFDARTVISSRCKGSFRATKPG